MKKHKQKSIVPLAIIASVVSPLSAFAVSMYGENGGAGHANGMYSFITYAGAGYVSGYTASWDEGSDYYTERQAAVSISESNPVFNGCWAVADMASGTDGCVSS